MTDFDSVRLVVVGDVMVDEYLLGDAVRISPEAPVPVVRYQERKLTPGGAANAARNARALGAHVSVCGVVGDDNYAEALERLIDEGDMLGELVRDPSRPTTVKTRILAGGQQLARLDREDAATAGSDTSRSVGSKVAELLARGADCLLLSDYGKGVLRGDLASKLIENAANYKVPVVVDPKGKKYERYAGADVVTPNVSEALIALEADDTVTIDWIGEQLSSKLPGTAIVLTRGSEGVTLFKPRHPRLDISAEARSVADVTGAGDTLAAVLATAIGAGLDIDEAVRLANRASGIAVSRVGTATISPDELR
jgi:rfaE bifunctional protein kinase chain/domain